MRIIKDAGRKLGVLNGLASFLWHNRLWWMIPILCAVAGVGLLVTLAAHPAAAPFVYTLF